MGHPIRTFPKQLRKSQKRPRNFAFVQESGRRLARNGGSRAVDGESGEEFRRAE